MPAAICLGELLVDFVSQQADVPLSALPPLVGAAGGAPANVAVGLARQGVDAGFIGKVGDDPFGEHLRTTVSDAGVDTAYLRTAAGVRTTLAFVAQRSDGRKDICFYRNPGADMMLEPAEVPESYIRSARLFHFGSVSLSEPPAREATLQAVRQAKSAGCLVSFDPNWRPWLWRDPGEGRTWIWRVIDAATVVKMAEEEFDFVTGTTDLPTGCQQVLDMGVELVVVTRGAAGCYYQTRRVQASSPGFAVEVADPLGAGDGFTAAMLARLLGAGPPAQMSRAELDAAMRWANAAGALTCTGQGVIPSLPTTEQVSQFLDRQEHGNG